MQKPQKKHDVGKQETKKALMTNKQHMLRKSKQQSPNWQDMPFFKCRNIQLNGSGLYRIALHADIHVSITLQDQIN